MKQLSVSIVFLLVSVLSFAQSGTKVKWDYTVKKISDKKYEVRMIATIQPGWHLYSQKQSADAIALPTKISFAKNPLITVSGAVKEVGKVTDAFDKATANDGEFVVFYDEKDFCYRIIDKNMRGTDIPSKRNIIHDLSIICDNESFEIKKLFNSLGKTKRKIIIKLSKNFKKFECYMTPYISY